MSYFYRLVQLLVASFITVACGGANPGILIQNYTPTDQGAIIDLLIPEPTESISAAIQSIEPQYKSGVLTNFDISEGELGQGFDLEGPSTGNPHLAECSEQCFQTCGSVFFSVLMCIGSKGGLIVQCSCNGGTSSGKSGPADRN